MSRSEKNCVKAAIAFVCTSCKRQILTALLQLITFVCTTAIENCFMHDCNCIVNFCLLYCNCQRFYRMSQLKSIAWVISFENFCTHHWILIDNVYMYHPNSFLFYALLYLITFLHLRNWQLLYVLLLLRTCEYTIIMVNFECTTACTIVCTIHIAQSTTFLCIDIFVSTIALDNFSLLFCNLNFYSQLLAFVIVSWTHH